MLFQAPAGDWETALNKLDKSPAYGADILGEETDNKQVKRSSKVKC